MSLKFRYQDYQVGNLKIRLRTLRDLEQSVLANLLQVENLADKQVLEIGCGMALASHTLNAMGADITAMDIHPVTQELLEDNTSLNNQPPISFVQGSWSNSGLNIGQFDLIVGSDILYEPKHVQHLTDFLDRHLKGHGEIIIVDPDRGQSETFLQDMKQRGFTSTQYEPEFSDGLGIPYSGSVFRFRRA